MRTLGRSDLCVARNKRGKSLRLGRNKYWVGYQGCLGHKNKAGVPRRSTRGEHGHKKEAKIHLLELGQG